MQQTSHFDDARKRAEAAGYLLPDTPFPNCIHAVPEGGACPTCAATRVFVVEFWAQTARGEPLTGPQKYVKGLAEDLLKQCEENAALKLLLSQIVSSEPCRLDHHGYCQEHMWVGKGECAHGRARKLLGMENPMICDYCLSSEPSKLSFAYHVCNKETLQNRITAQRQILMRIYENARGLGDSVHAVTRWEIDTADYQALEDFLFPKDEAVHNDAQ